MQEGFCDLNQLLVKYRRIAQRIIRKPAILRIIYISQSGWSFSIGTESIKF